MEKKERAFKETVHILKDELTKLGIEIKHSQALNFMSKLEGHKTYKDRCTHEKKNETINIEINKELLNNFISQRDELQVSSQRLIESLIEQEIHQAYNEVKLYKCKDIKFNTYLVFAKNRNDALSIIDASYLPLSSNTYNISDVKEISLTDAYGVMIVNTWGGIDKGDTFIGTYKEEIVDTIGYGKHVYSDVLLEYIELLDNAGFYESNTLLDHNDILILSWLKELEENEPNVYKKYIELRKKIITTSESISND